MTITSKVPMLALAAAAAAAALALLAWSPPAHAGGWAVTTLDPLAAAPQAGTTVTVGYTVRQHGITPVAVEGTGIAVVAADGTRTVFPGRPSGPTGHYVADVRIPAGAADWEAEQGWFEPQKLGAVPVALSATPAAAGVAPAPAAARGGGPGGGAWALLAATLAAAALLGARALTLRRRTPGEPAA